MRLSRMMATHGPAPGFTLLEVLVALAILSVAVVASIQGFAQGLRLLKLAGDHQHATLIADQKAREIVVPKEGHATGEEERAGTTFAWETTTTAIEAPDLAATNTATPTWHAYRIVVDVRWGGRHVELATLRTTSATLETTTFPVTPGSPTTPQTGQFTPATPPATRTPPARSPTPSTDAPPSPRRPPRR